MNWVDGQNLSLVQACADTSMGSLKGEFGRPCILVSNFNSNLTINFRLWLCFPFGKHSWLRSIEVVGQHPPCFALVTHASSQPDYKSEWGQLL